MPRLERRLEAGGESAMGATMEVIERSRASRVRLCWRLCSPPALCRRGGASFLEITRKPDGNVKLPPIGNTVDVATATFANTIGAPELITVWPDPDFDPTQPAFYYMRVIEIPTPRWRAYEAVRFGVEIADDVSMVTQERAYTRPIWLTPEG